MSSESKILVAKTFVALVTLAAIGVVVTSPIVGLF